MDNDKIIIENGVMINPQIFEEEDEIDLFEFYEELPQNIQDILLEFGESMDNDEERRMLKVLEPLGYTFEVGMDGCAYGLRKLKEDEK